MPQTRYGYDWFRPGHVASTVQLRRALRLTVDERTNYREPTKKEREDGAKPRKPLKRRTVMDVGPGVPYHALIDEEAGTVRLFVAHRGFIEEVTIGLEEVCDRFDRVDPDVDYRKWGNNRVTDVSVEVLE